MSSESCWLLSHKIIIILFFVWNYKSVKKRNCSFTLLFTKTSRYYKDAILVAKILLEVWLKINWMVVFRIPNIEFFRVEYVPLTRRNWKRTTTFPYVPHRASSLETLHSIQSIAAYFNTCTVIIIFLLYFKLYINRLKN